MVNDIIMILWFADILVYLLVMTSFLMIAIRSIIIMC